MGNREDLLRGARRCLEERGWANTTARDIATAAGGVSHAAIFYHFGSREALLTAALIEAVEERLTTFRTAIAQSPSADTATQFRSMWKQFDETFESQRGMWLSHFEAVLHAQQSEDLRTVLAENQIAGRIGGVSWLTGKDATATEVDEHAVRSLGSVYLALIAGVAWQRLVDPSTAPRSGDIVDGIGMLASLLSAQSTPDRAT
ncbi:TetR/AcrR family transcriptional regulator [Nocardia ninae]|uniref:TetR/AcrR family transcriptional regulator n=1 Tax=Nocardia ninae TaxID=356145 RepID=UPI0011BE30F2|nr:TetR/AcrR family transcriptional regulator [Nocardia ninae]